MAHWPRTGCSVIVRRDDRILLVKRDKDPFKGAWSLPGGSQEPGETLKACAHRELLEETDLHADQLEFLVVRDRMGHDHDGKLTHHFVLATFYCETFTGEAVAGDDASDLGWFTIEESRELETTPGTPDFIQDILKERVT